MLSVLLAIVLTAASPSPSPAPVSSAEPKLGQAWKILPLDKDQYAHYARTEADGTQSDITATRQVCDCQPPHLMQMLSSALTSVRGITSAIDTVAICGGPQLRFIATGIANPGNGARNMEVIAFRREPALYVLQYTFKSSKPLPDAEAALAALCP